MNHKYRGFTLAEALGVIAVIVVLTLGAIYVANSTATTGRRDTAMEQQARAMTDLTAAARGYITDQGYAWPDGQRQITVAELIAAGRLPPDWQSRFGAVGATPLGQTYVASVVKGGPATAKEYRLLVTEATSPVKSRMGRIGLDPTQAERVRAYKAKVADLLQRRHNINAGLTGAPPSTVTMLGGMQLGITQQSSSPAFAAVSVAILDGYPELNSNGASNGCPGGNCPAPKQYQQCSVVAPVGGITGITGTCPAQYEEVARWPHCRMLYTDGNQDPILSTPVGPVTFHQAVGAATAAIPECGGTCAYLPPTGSPECLAVTPREIVCSRFDSLGVSGDIESGFQLNVKGRLCTGTGPARKCVNGQEVTYSMAANVGIHQGIQLSQAALPSSNYLCTNSTATTQGWGFRNILSPPRRSGAATAPMDLLCCLPQ